MRDSGKVDIKTPYRLSDIRGNDRIESVTISGDDGDVDLPCDALLLQLGFKTALGPLADWPLAIEKGSIVVDPRMKTTMEGVWAAGDVTTFDGKLKLIATGFAEASTAVLAGGHPASARTSGCSRATRRTPACLASSTDSPRAAGGDPRSRAVRGGVVLHPGRSPRGFRRVARIAAMDRDDQAEDGVCGRPSAITSRPSPAPAFDAAMRETMPEMMKSHHQAGSSPLTGRVSSWAVARIGVGIARPPDLAHHRVRAPEVQERDEPHTDRPALEEMAIEIAGTFR